MQNRRYIFIDYEDLVNIKFKKLEKICSRIFVFVHSEVSAVPIRLVQQMQKMGKNIRWISVENIDRETSLHMSFLMGKLHEKVSTDIEFAILSDEESFDPLVNFINETGRNCIRVKQKVNYTKKYQEEEEELSIELIEEEQNTDNDNQHFIALEAEEEVGFDENYEASVMYQAQNDYSPSLPFEVSPELNTKTTVVTKSKKLKKSKLQTIEKMAEETIRRLIRSGNRPSEISMLKSYILLQHQDQNSPEMVDLVIDHMKETKDIRLETEEVIYNF